MSCAARLEAVAAREDAENDVEDGTVVELELTARPDVVVFAVRRVRVAVDVEEALNRLALHTQSVRHDVMHVITTAANKQQQFALTSCKTGRTLIIRPTATGQVTASAQFTIKLHNQIVQSLLATYEVELRRLTK